MKKIKLIIKTKSKNYPIESVPLIKEFRADKPVLRITKN